MANTPDVRIRLSAEGVQEVVSALKNVQSQAKKTQTQVNSVPTGLSAAAAGVTALSDSVAGLGKAAAGLVALDAIKNIAQFGVDANASLESSTQSLATVLSSQGRIADGNGKLLKGQDAYNAAVDMSSAYMSTLHDKSQSAGLDFQELAKISSKAIFAGINSGITDMSKMGELVVKVAQNMKLMGMSTNQTGIMISQMLAGRRNRLSTELHLDGATLKSWEQAGTLVDNLNKRLDTNGPAAAAMANTFSGLAARAKSAMQDFMRPATEGLFNGIKSGFSSMLDGMYDQTGKLRPQVQAVADAFNGISTVVGGAIATGLDLCVTGARNFGTWLQNNGILVDGIAGSFKSLSTTIGDAVKGIVSIAQNMSLATRMAGFLAAAFNSFVGLVDLGVAGIQSVRAAMASDPAQKVYLENEAALARKAALLQDKKMAANMKQLWTGQDSGSAPGTAPSEKKKSTARLAGAANPRLPDTSELNAANALAKAKADAEKAAAQREMAELKAKLAKEDEANSESYANRLESLDQYNARRLESIRAENAAELQAAEGELKAAEALPAKDEAAKVKRQEAIDNATSKIAQVKLQGDLKEMQVTQQSTQAVKALNDEWDSFQQSQAQRDGDLAKAAQLGLDAELDKYDQLLAKMGKVGEEKEQLKEAYRKKAQGKIDFDLAKADADGTSGTATALKLNSMDENKAQIQRNLGHGDLFPIQAEEQQLELERQRIPVLEGIAQRMLDAAKASGNPALIQQAEKYKSSIEDMKVATDEYGQAIAKLKAGLQDGVSNGLNNMLDNIISGTMNARDAIKQFAFDVVDSIRKIAQEILIHEAMKSLFGGMASTTGAAAASAGGGGGGGGGSMLSGLMGGLSSFFGSGMSFFADGGHVRGAGTGTSDSIPAMLSNGEFVVRAAAVSQPGMLAALHLLNSGGRMPAMRAPSKSGVARFADGGLVGSLAQAHNGASSRLEIGLEDGLVLKALESSAGQTAVVKALSNKRKTMRQLGY